MDSGAELAATPTDGGEPSQVEATIRHVVFSSDDSGWAVVRCQSTEGRSFSAVGTLLGLREGDEMRFSGVWKQHPKYG